MGSSTIGRSEAIKVKLKFDKSGVRGVLDKAETANPGESHQRIVTYISICTLIPAIVTQIGGNGSEEFTFPWWDHAFNRAAANIVIADDSDDDEVCDAVVLDAVRLWPPDKLRLPASHASFTLDHSEQCEGLGASFV